MNLINKILHRILVGLSIFIFVLLVVDVSLGVASRYLIGNQIRWTEELATFLLVWLVFCGASIAYHDNSHLGINLLTNNLEKRSRIVALTLSNLIVFAFIASVMLWGGFLLTIERFESGQMMSTLGIHKAWLYLSVPLNGFFMSMFNIGKTLEMLRPKQEEGGVLS
ncbi:MAG: TRAP transporter small permease [Opitutales bacterium]|nr:TRAP transporter small permease [Opitutales bacterium]